MPENRLLITVLIVSTVFGLGCSIGQEKTVPGPESDKLAAATAGYVLTSTPPGGITATRLPMLQETIVRPAGPQNPNDMPTIHALSGPDMEGRIAYIEDHFFVANEKQPLVEDDPA